MNTLADAVDVAERTGLGIVADIGNFWMERDLRATLLRAAPHIDLVQLTDVSIGTVRSPDDPPSGGRVPFGEGDLPLARILGDIKDTGYAGPLELELIGPLGDSEGYAPVIRRGVAAADGDARRKPGCEQRKRNPMTRMSRAVVMPGDGTWELRELPVPDPPPGGAVLRVEAVGMCHSDIDHMHGIVHTPWGGAYPSIPGHEIVGRIDALAAGDRRPVGRQGGPAGRRPRVGAAARRHPRLRPRLRDRRAVRPVRRVRRLHGTAAGDAGRAAPGRHPGRGAHGLGAARHRRPVGDRGQARRLGGDPGARAPRPGLDRRRPARPAPSGSSSPARPPTPSGSTRPAGWASRRPSTSAPPTRSSASASSPATASTS